MSAVDERRSSNSGEFATEFDDFTQRRSVAKSVGCFQRRLFVYLFVNTITSERVSITC